MAPISPKSHLFLLHFLALLLLAQSRSSPTLLRSDLAALRLVHQSLGLRGAPAANPCGSAATSCAANSSLAPLRVTAVALDARGLPGRLHPAVSQLAEIKKLSLADNNLTGPIPPKLADCTKLEILNLRNNRLAGPIPAALSALVRLRVLDLAGNQLTGDLNFLANFPNLERLDLAGNMLAGAVPASVKSFRNLRYVDLSGNRLLSGNLPKRYSFAEITAGALAGAAPAPAPGPALAPAGRGSKINKKKRIIGWSLGFAAGVIGGILSGLVFSLVFKLLLVLINGRDKDNGIKIFSPLIKKPEDLAFLEKEDGLNSLNIIGKGGCGEVYKAELPGSGGKEIAIKKINQSPTDADDLTDEDSKLLNKKMRQIRSEIKTVGEIRHRNLLPLLAHLPRPDCHYLVYEYMKNGSVHDYLLKVARGEKELDWLARYKIIMGIAAGLEYLHTNHTPRIIHRDLKPANVLLDDEMEARIADFGMAKSVPDANTHVSTSNIAGTMGYIAPEYHQTFKFTDKCDVYSFGVVLAAIVMGKMPSDEFFQRTDEVSLVKWMRNVMASDDPKRAIDPKLIGNGFEEQMLLALKVAFFCTLDNPKERPSSKDARAMLAQITH